LLKLSVSSDDFEDILKRAAAAGVEKQILTGGSLSSSRQVLQLAQRHGVFTLKRCEKKSLTLYELLEGLYSTVGCHPCHAKDFLTGANAYLKALDDLITADQKGPKRIVAVGECGLGDS